MHIYAYVYTFARTVSVSLTTTSVRSDTARSTVVRRMRARAPLKLALLAYRTVATAIYYTDCISVRAFV